MKKIATSRKTGLTLALPEKWRSVEHEAFALVLVDRHEKAATTFVPNLVATVVPLLEGDDLNSFTERNALAWAEQSGGVVAHVGTAPTEHYDGREVFGLYSEGSLGIAVHTLLFAENGLGTRIDLSFRVWDAPEGSTLAPYLLSEFTPPHSASSSDLTETQLTEFLQEVTRG